jgi:hypothetical protein
MDAAGGAAISSTIASVAMDESHLISPIAALIAEEAGGEAGFAALRAV